MKVGHGDEEEDEEGIEYPVVKMKSVFLSDASATPLYWHQILHREIDTAVMCGCSQRVFGLVLGVLADEGPRGQQEGGGESPRFPFGTPYGTCVPLIMRYCQNSLKSK